MRSGMGGGEDEHAVVLVNGVDESNELGGGEEPHLPAAPNPGHGLPTQAFLIGHRSRADHV